MIFPAWQLLFSIAQPAKVLSTLASCAVGHLNNNILGTVSCS